MVPRIIRKGRTQLVTGSHRWLMRIIGCLNIAYCIAGIRFYVEELHPYHGRWPGSPNEHDWVAFICLSAISLSFDVYLFVLGVQLIRSRVAAVSRTLWTMVAEIVYEVLNTWIFWVALSPHLGNDLAGGFFTKALFPLAPQIVTGYPLFGGLIMGFLMYRGRRQARHEERKS
jgi:hypothetical protein